MNTKNLEQQEIHTKVSNEYETCEWIMIIIASLLFALLSKKIIDQMKANRRQKKLIETPTKSNEAL